MHPSLLGVPLASHGIPNSGMVMIEDWRFILVMTLLIVLGALLPFAFETV
jgi:hypothetical protein